MNREELLLGSAQILADPNRRFGIPNYYLQKPRNLSRRFPQMNADSHNCFHPRTLLVSLTETRTHVNTSNGEEVTRDRSRNNPY